MEHSELGFLFHISFQYYITCIKLHLYISLYSDISIHHNWKLVNIYRALEIGKLKICNVVAVKWGRVREAVLVMNIATCNFPFSSLKSWFHSDGYAIVYRNINYSNFPLAWAKLIQCSVSLWNFTGILGEGHTKQRGWKQNALMTWITKKL